MGGFTQAASSDEAVDGADLVVVCTPIPTIAPVVAAALAATTGTIVTEVGSIMGSVSRQVLARRRVGGPPAVRAQPPDGGSERSGPEHASPVGPRRHRLGGLADGRVRSRRRRALETWIEGLGARAVRMPADRHDRLVAFVSHLPQVASTALMSLAATEEADEPEILLLAAGGFRDLTRLAASDAGLWSSILLANGEQIAEAIDLYVDRLRSLRETSSGAEATRCDRRSRRRKRLVSALRPSHR